MPRDNPPIDRTDGVLLDAAGLGQCRWIVSRIKRGVYMVCGRSVLPGSSFCVEHHARAWRLPRD